MSEEPPRKPDWEHVKWVEPRDEEKDASPLVRWAGLAVLIILAAGLMGAVFVLGPYFLAVWLSGSSRHYSSTRGLFGLLLDNDTFLWVKARFWFGAAIGAAGAVWMWVRANRPDE